MNMCRLAFEGVPTVVVSDAERRSFQRMIRKDMAEDEIQTLRVGTADLLDMLICEEPGTQFSFCLGTDTFMDLTAWKWKRSKDVLRLLDGRLVVLHRKGMTNEDLHERVDLVNQTDGKGNVVLMQVPSLRDISSSSVRSIVDEEKLSDKISPEVLEYIKIHKLYGFSEA